MARAKRTDRAEARRKYRAYLQAQEEAAAASGDQAAADDAEPSGAKRSPAGERKGQPATQPGARKGFVATEQPVRLGFVGAARAAYRTPHYIDDIRNIRVLVFGSNTVWPVLAICVIAGLYAGTRFASNSYSGDPVLPFVFQFLFYPVPLIPPMLAGFLAPRSTWLAGVIASFIATMTLVVVLGLTAVTLTQASDTIAGSGASPSAQASSTATGPAASGTILATASPAPSPSAAVSVSPAPSPSTAPAQSGTTGSQGTDMLSLTVILLGQSLGFGALMGALSGWYKRFLALSSVPRNKPPARPKGGRAPQRRPAAKK